MNTQTITVTSNLGKQIVREYNRVCDHCLALTGTSRDRLSTLSDDDLMWFIAGKTLAFGRNAQDSLENAKLHLEDRAKAIKCFTTADPEADYRIGE